MLTSNRVRAAAWLAVLALAVAAGWMAATGRHSLSALDSPMAYSGDALAVLTWIKAYGAGEILPLLPKQIHGLGAPFGANWTDFPAEDFLYAAAALFSSVFGLWAGSTLFVLALHVLAGVAFFVVATALRYSSPIAFGGALLFALAPFGFSRELHHLTVTAYWHIPLILFAVKWAGGGVDSEGSVNFHRFLAAMGAVFAGFLNPYYLFALLWLAGWVLLGAAASARRRDIVATVGIIALALIAFFIQSLDSLWMNLEFGRNPQALVRDFPSLDTYGLRLPDLVFPYIHRSPWVQHWADVLYQTAAPGGRGRGEAITSYLGIVGAAALAALLVTGTIRVAARQFARVSDWYWMALAIIGLAVVGGVNYLLGAFGFVLLRATNRLSIVLLAIALLWLCERASAARRRIPVLILAVAALAAGLWDQVPQPGMLFPAPAALRAQVDADARFVNTLESALPKDAMVLQLPIKKFPETGPVRQMEDYEHLRPYLHSRSVRFSYGTTRGRSDADWQDELVPLPMGELAARASQYGFAAIQVNRKAYEENARALEAELTGLLGAPIAANGDLVAFRLPSAAATRSPVLRPSVRYHGFMPTEAGDGHAWTWAARQEASIVVRRPFPESAARDAAYEVSFALESANGGDVSVALDGTDIAVVRPGQSGNRIRLPLDPARREWRIEFRSNRPPQLPGNGDPRRIAFRTIDFGIRGLER